MDKPWTRPKDSKGAFILLPTAKRKTKGEVKDAFKGQETMGPFPTILFFKENSKLPLF